MKLLQKNTLIKQFPAYGCHLFIDSEEMHSLHIILLKKKKGEIIIEKQDSFESIGAMAEGIQTKHPVCLSIGGKGIFTQLAESSDENAFNTLLPDAKKEDFFIKDYKCISGERIIAFARNSQIGTIANEFSKHKIQVASIDLQFGSIIPFQGMFEKAQLSGWNINSDSSHFTYSKGNKNVEGLVKFQDQEIKSDYFIPYCNALQFFLPSFFTQSDADSIYKENFLYKWHTKMLLQFGVGILFIALLANFFLFDHYNNKYNSISSQYSSNLSKIEKLKKLKDEYRLKKEVISNAGLDKVSALSKFLDEIAASIPKQMQLERMEANPISKKVKQGKSIEFSKNIIQIGGNVRNSQTFYQWVEDLRSISFIEDVSIDNYFHEDNKGKGVFLVTVATNSSKINN